ncbi:MAG: ADP-ribosylglycohydrolase family protein, partial [Pseudanabaena sp. ELA607]
GATECLDASWLFGDMLCQVLAGASKTELLFSYAADHDCQQLAPSIQAIAQGNYRDKTIAQIRGSGYVVASLEAALWCFWHTENYEQAVLAATNLGDDADTTAAICGSLAGAYYGVRNIPESWRNKLAMVEQITTLADQLHQVATTR